MIVQFIATALEFSLNNILFSDRYKPVESQRLIGKTLNIKLQELGVPLTLLFHERQLEVVSQWQEEADCTVTTRLMILAELRDRSALTRLIKSGDLVVDGDLQVVQQFTALLERSEWDFAEFLAPYTGDIIAEGLSQAIRTGSNWIKQTFEQRQTYLSEALVEEWRLLPSHLEMVWLNDEIAALEQRTDALINRLNGIEKDADSQ